MLNDVLRCRKRLKNGKVVAGEDVDLPGVGRRQVWFGYIRTVIVVAGALLPS